MLRRAIALVLAGLVTVAVTGCNTMAGLGRDIEKGGQVIQEKSSR
jgi:predicted small secreted protein